jgi:hypothetical protein
MTDTTGVATVLPGGYYHHDLPLLLFAGQLLEQRGWEVRRVTWSAAVDDRAAALAQAEGELADVQAGRRHVVVGKSLGTLALPAAVRAGLPGIWLTPLCQEPELAAAIRTATAPTLLVGGTGDQAWDGEVARSGSAAVLELEGADHALAVPDAVASVEYLRHVVLAMAEFLDRI